GPDKLGNSFYRDCHKELVPILTVLYNKRMSNGVFPESFREAYIYSITKQPRATNPLNYRPISLLNTDYKVLIKIYATRMRRCIAELVHQTQFGFVPGRNIHTAIDLVETSTMISRSLNPDGQAQVLMLDFSKAYDSVDREFMLATLAAKGLPPRLLRMIRSLHTGTTATFLDNGRISCPITVSSGIRQGCPLAPLLFIIVVDVLYDMIEKCDTFTGVLLEGQDTKFKLKVAGYADDTAKVCTILRA
ncbi:Reverse transcriptase precursor, partial [Phytophthora megakarya]